MKKEAIPNEYKKLIVSRNEAWEVKAVLRSGRG